LKKRIGLDALINETGTREVLFNPGKRFRNSRHLQGRHWMKIYVTRKKGFSS